MKQSILVINGHPDKESLCSALAEAYARGSRTSAIDCELIHLSDLDFDPVLHNGYRVVQELEPDLLMLQERIRKAEHLVFVYPVWWGTYPSLLKGMIDRAFLPGFMFKFHPNGYSWDKFMKNKSARLIVTMNSPKWYYKYMIGRPGDHAMRRSVLRFAGFKPVRITHLGPVNRADATRRAEWLQKIESMGKKAL